MRTLLKIVVVLVVIVLVAAAAGVTYVFARYPDVPAPESVTVQSSPEKMARGEYLSKHVTGCLVCHAERDFTKFSGPVIESSLGRGGDSFGDPDTAVKVLFSTNITPRAIGAWTDGELIRAFTAGVDKDGDALFPIMPYRKYAKLSREDVEAIVVYIRSLKPLDYTAPPRELGMPLPLVVRTIPKAASFRPIPPVADRVAYGEYIVNAASCGSCHTPIDDQGQPVPGMDFAGGFELKMPGGAVVRSANITPDADTGIGTWSEQQFVEKFKAFENAPQRVLTTAEQRENTVMPWTSAAGMTREDLSAVYAYLRTVKPVVNRVAKH